MRIKQLELSISSEAHAGELRTPCQFIIRRSARAYIANHISVIRHISGISGTTNRRTVVYFNNSRYTEVHKFWI